MTGSRPPRERGRRHPRRRPSRNELAQYRVRCRRRVLPTQPVRASDLLSKHLGDTEKNLCDMFDEARDDEAVLLLDEADSFLQDRTLAHRQWEVSEVNELL